MKFLAERWYLLDSVKRTRRRWENLICDKQVCKLGSLVVVVARQHCVMNCFEYFTLPP